MTNTQTVQQRVPAVKRFKLSRKALNWLAALSLTTVGVMLLLYNLAARPLTALLLGAVFVLAAAACTISYGTVVGFVGGLQWLGDKFRNRPFELVNDELSETLIELSDGREVYAHSSGFGVKLIPVPILDEKDELKHIGVLYDTERERAALIITHRGNTRLVNADETERQEIDRQFAKSWEKAGLQVDSKLEATMVTARRPRSTAELAEAEVEFGNSDIIRAMGEALADIQLDNPTQGAANIGANTIDKFEQTVVGSPNYLHVTMVELPISSEWLKKPKEANPEENSKVDLMRVAYVLMDIWSNAGFNELDICSYVEAIVTLKSLQNIANLPGYIADVQREMQENRPLREAKTLKRGPWHKRLQVGPMDVIADGESHFRPFKFTSDDEGVTSPGGFDNWMASSLPGFWSFGIRMKMVPLASRIPRDHIARRVREERIERLVERWGEGHPKVREAREQLQAQDDAEHESGGNSWDVEYYLALGALDQQQLQDWSDVVLREASNKGLEFTSPPGVYNRAAAFYNACGVLI